MFWKWAFIIVVFLYTCSAHYHSIPFRQVDVVSLYAPPPPMGQECLLSTAGAVCVHTPIQVCFIHVNIIVRKVVFKYNIDLWDKLNFPVGLYTT